MFCTPEDITCAVSCRYAFGLRGFLHFHKLEEKQISERTRQEIAISIPLPLLFLFIYVRFIIAHLYTPVDYELIILHALGAFVRFSLPVGLRMLTLCLSAIIILLKYCRKRCRGTVPGTARFLKT